MRTSPGTSPSLLPAGIAAGGALAASVALLAIFGGLGSVGFQNVPFGGGASEAVEVGSPLGADPVPAGLVGRGTGAVTKPSRKSPVPDPRGAGHDTGSPPGPPAAVVEPAAPPLATQPQDQEQAASAPPSQAPGQNETRGKGNGNGVAKGHGNGSGSGNGNGNGNGKAKVQDAATSAPATASPDSPGNSAEAHSKKANGKTKDG